MMENCGKSNFRFNQNKYIARGQEASDGQFPWLVYISNIVVKGNRVLLTCSGSLISGEFILTAANLT